ncbi:MAG: DUF411 domain-containing protein [Rhodobacteraceae bacterium]|nr:DUF411 domain-containing protein [Paracoccaceae bacterium]
MRNTLFTTTALLFAFGGAAYAQTMNVAKNISCGCCGAWIEQMQAAGFDTSATNLSHEALSELKASVGVSIEMTSCHTAIVEGYVVEGHVPVADIRRLLAERPEAIGIATPGMPTGSPGMEYNGIEDAYSVYLLLPDEKYETYASYPGNR